MTRPLALILSAVAPLLASAATALAADSSTITSPAGPVYIMNDFNAPGATIPVSGTATFAGGQGILRCYSGAGIGGALAGPFAAAGPFASAAPVSAFSPGLGHLPCRLRVVPSSDSDPHPAADASDPFDGPLVAGGWSVEDNGGGSRINYSIGASTLTGGFAFTSAGSCGIDNSDVIDTAFAHADGPFSCAGALGADSHATRSDIQVDGVDAYDPSTAYNDTPGDVNQPLTLTKAFDTATGLITIATREPIYECAAGAVPYPATDAACPSLRSAGLELDRTYQTSAGGRVADVTDVWVVTDGHPHALSLLLREGVKADLGNGGAFELPGQTSFAAPVAGATHTFPAGPGTILYKLDQQTPDVGDHSSPQGSISYSTAPDGPAVFTSVDQVHGTSQLTLPYTRTIPAGGRFTLKMRFADDFVLAPVQSEAAAAVAQYLQDGPAVTGPPSSGGSPPPPGGTASPQLRLAGKLHVSGTTATVKVSCAGAPCPVAALLTTTERLTGRKVTGVSARNRRKKTVKVAAKSLTIPAGATATVKLSLNRTGKSLLARFGKLPARLRLTSAGHDVASARATFKRSKRRKR